MCGIVGCVAQQDAQPILVHGLHQLEYRGYDSAGIATISAQGLMRRRVAGRVEMLGRLLDSDPVEGSVGIAHTRWATHGRPTENNAHPHLDASGRIALVHNGVIENHATLRTFLEQQGLKFDSETDTEVLAKLIGFFYTNTGDLLEAIRNALQEVSGTFGLALICSEFPGTLIAARRGSPLLVGVSDREYYVASDASPFADRISKVTYLEDDEIVMLNAEGMQFTNVDALVVEKEFSEIDLILEEIELNNYEHYMQKEILEQPDSIRNAQRGRLDVTNGAVVLGGLSGIERELALCKRMLLFGCGTAWHAALIGEYLMEDIAGVSAEVEYASELRYRNPLIEEGTLAIAISQSGETADTLAALREVKAKGATTMGVVNTVGSSIARETDAGVYLHIGKEVGVASTKAFLAQVTLLSMIATAIGRRKRLSPERAFEIVAELNRLPDKIAQVLECQEQVRALAYKYADKQNWLYLGRGVNFPVALEGALKLKEVSYIHAEGLPAAEMKHGPIALIDRNVPVVVLAVKDHTYAKVMANIEEVRSRDAQVIAIATEGDREIAAVAGEVIYVPEIMSFLSPIVTTIPLQFLAYYAALARGRDVDKPRNLAKSVTVE